MLAKNTNDKYRKNCKNNKRNIIQDIEREEAKKGPEKSANVGKIAKVTRIFLVDSFYNLHGVKCAKKENGKETKHIKPLYLLNHLLTKVTRFLC